MTREDSVTIGFVGMTHLGLISAVGASEKGYKVCCFDPDHALINNLKKNNTSIEEPKLKELLLKNKISFNSDFGEIKKCGLIYVAPDITTDDRGESDLSKIDQLLNIVFGSIKYNAIIVILSQVPPGYTRSKQRDGVNLFYQVETLIFGQAIDRTLYPERFIVGCSEPEENLPEAYERYLLSYGCPVLKMKYESAELAKISINMFLVSSVVTTNTLAELCESIGAVWSEIVPALRLDRRIGGFAYINPGLGIAGGNLERDLTTFSNYANQYNTDSLIVDAWKKNSDLRKNWIWKIYTKLSLYNNESIRIGLLGLSYKENTNSIKNSAAIEFLKKINSCNVIAYDPVVPENAISNKIIHASRMTSAIKDADVLIIATAWEEFRSITLEMLLKNMRGNVIIDPYGILATIKLGSYGFKYYSLGSPMNN